MNIASANKKENVNKSNFSIECVGNQAVIKVDLSFVNIESLNKMIERLRIEELIKKADFRGDIAEIGSDIKKSWWQKNREHYLRGVI
ncbi:MAG: hypothetical protein HQK64_02640 [Desulfamplus sp.]|nr:hypothetical protein [Desulfamplus sp.]MBF0241359.1 hypothetical protein [Desulfamplus sp.]MBF0389097.1 hypothetical protein [Desulfamplus sp.]